MNSSTLNASVIVITGPSGAGKSAISRKLATELGRCVDIDIEHVNYMIVEGFKEDEQSGDISFERWCLAGDTIGLLAKHFISNGYRVIIHGHVNEELLSSIEKRVAVSKKFLLLPNLKAIIARDSNRGKHLTMGENMVRKHYEYFLQNKWDGFIEIDSTNEEIDTTLNKIKKELE